MIPKDLSFGLLLAIQALFYPTKTLERLHQSNFHPSLLIRRVCAPLFFWLFALGCLGLMYWGAPEAYWNFRDMIPNEVFKHLLPSFSVAFVLMGLCLLARSKLLQKAVKGSALEDTNFQRKCILSSLVLMSSGFFFFIPYLGQLYFIPLISAAELLSSKSG
jgi:hypothetical protein